MSTRLKKLLSVAAMVAVCSYGASALAANTLTIGTVSALSGPAAAWGQGQKNAVTLAAEDVNKNGGLVVNGTTYTVKVISYDGAGVPAKAIAATRRMIQQDHVNYILGYSISPTTLAGEQFAGKHKVITAAMGFARTALGPKHPFAFRGDLSSVEFAGPQIAWEVKHLKLKKIGALLPNDATGQQMGKTLTAEYKSAGASLSPILYFQRSDTNFTSLLTRLFADGVDAIELDGNPPETSGLIVKQARALGFKGYILKAGGPSTAQIIKVAGKEAAEGAYVLDVINVQDPAMQKFMERYSRRFNMSMNHFVPNFYDMTMLIFEAMKNAGTVSDTVKVRDALEKIKDYKGVSGMISMIGKKTYGVNRQIGTPFFISRVHDGKEITVAKCDVTACRSINP